MITQRTHTLTGGCSVWILRRAARCLLMLSAPLNPAAADGFCDQSYEFFSKIDASGWKCCQNPFVPSPFDKWIWNGHKNELDVGELFCLLNCFFKIKPCSVLFWFFVYYKYGFSIRKYIFRVLVFPNNCILARVSSIHTKIIEKALWNIINYSIKTPNCIWWITCWPQ